jgi:GntR family transcriptional regulator/MocR family aminotransferase
MLGITLNRQSAAPLKRQLYAQLKDAVTSGMLKSGEAMLSTRELSRDLGVSRNTVGEAYDMLIAEGYLLSRQGAPTRVAEGLRLEDRASGAPVKARPVQAVKFSFRTGRPDLRQFPRKLWLQAMRRSSENLAAEYYGYTGPQGLDALREEIAGWLFRTRGLNAAAEDIFITAGATHALNLACVVLGLSGRSILMEDPCHSGMLQTFRDRSCRIVPVPVDGHGMQTERLDGAPDIAAVYVTPSHQFPLGGILSAPRRAALIRFARENDAYIIEDDYDSEFRYGGAPVSPLVAADPLRVIYVGTFSKVLFPALRIGYAVVPRPLQKRWRVLRTHDDVQNPIFEQAALAEFMRARQLDSHIRKMRKLYGARRAVLLEALRASFGGAAALGDAAGLHLAVHFPGMIIDESFAKRCRAAGIDVTPVEAHCIDKGRHGSELLLGYGHLEPDEIRAAVLALREFMDLDK